MGAIRKLKDFADREALVFVYNTLAQPDFEYCCEVWDSPGDSLHRDYRGFRIGAQELLWTAETRLVNQKLLCKLKVGSLLPNKTAKNKAKAMFKICFKKFFMAWHRLHYQISLQTPTQSIVIIILEIQLKILKRDFLKKKSKLQWSQDMEWFTRGDPKLWDPRVF